MHLGTKMTSIVFDKSLVPPSYQIWVSSLPYIEQFWDGNSFILAIINLYVARLRYPTKYIKLECR